MIEPCHVLVADPPWSLKDQLPGPGRGAGKHYDLMSTPEICSMQLPPTHKNCVLFLWRLASMQQDALEVCKAWGFVPKAELVWQKLTKTGKKHFGMGHYVRNSHETCLIAARGRVRDIRGSASIHSTFEAPMPLDSEGKVLHSAKPDAFYSIVQQLFIGPYTELFARRVRPGWTCLGNEIPDEYSLQYLHQMMGLPYGQ